jgi:hypothetical protein
MSGLHDFSPMVKQKKSTAKDSHEDNKSVLLAVAVFKAVQTNELWQYSEWENCLGRQNNPTIEYTPFFENVNG